MWTRSESLRGGAGVLAAVVLWIGGSHYNEGDTLTRNYTPARPSECAAITCVNS